MPERFIDPYIDAKTGILRNRLGITNAEDLAKAERKAVIAATRNVPRGDFDALHVQAIHRHLFGQVYPWAGKLRTDVPILTKGASTFLPGAFIATGLFDIHKQVRAADYLKGLSPKAFAIGAARIVGDLNYVHPFREGNGRVQYQFLKQLGERAGHRIDLRKLPGRQWIRASISAHGGRYGRMAALIYRALSESRAKD